MDRKYYEAYDDRYRQVHAQGLRWFVEMPSPILLEVIKKYQIHKTAKLLELGCGEGRDAVILLRQGYNLLATDISAEAVSYCKRQNPEFEDEFAVLDCVNGNLTEKFDFIYAIAVLHMLVDDHDRKAMLNFIREHLADGGIALVCTMGDGKMERCSDTSTAFDLQERCHEQTGKVIHIAGTSYRAVSFDTFGKELDYAGLTILEQGLTDIEPDYFKMMYAVVKRKR